MRNGILCEQWYPLHESLCLQERRDYAAELSERRSKEKEQLRASFPPGKHVAKELFYFVDFQSLCEVPIKGQTHYLPCEVALVEFSLLRGITRRFHKFIDPGVCVVMATIGQCSGLVLPLGKLLCHWFDILGKIPMGYRFSAQSTSETTHQIPISDFDLAERDYRKLLGDIEQFLDPNWTEVMPVLFSKVSHYLIVSV